MGTVGPRAYRGMRRLPTFLVIGAMKAGTESLYHYLRRHPQVFMSETKELDYFTEELNWNRGLSWYECQFAGAGNAFAVGEASTSYSKYPTYRGVPDRMAKLLPDLRLVYVTRHPVERMKSQYLHEALIGEEHDPVEKALLTKSRYLDYSRYGLQISEYLKRFPREQLLVITSESLRSARKQTLRHVYSFLGVDPYWEDITHEKEYHRTADKRVPRALMGRLQMSVAYRAVSRVIPRRIKDAGRPLTTRGIDPARAILSDSLTKQLEMMLRDDLERLREFLGPNFEAWGILDVPTSEFLQ